MEFKSAIRDGQITHFLEKAVKKIYVKYLRKVLLCPIRGYKDEAVSFYFPVAARIQPNCNKKTSALGSASSAYSSIEPVIFSQRMKSLIVALFFLSINQIYVGQNLN